MSGNRQRRRHSRKRRPINFQVYAVITLACSLLALLVHFALEGTSKVKDYANDAANNIVNDAVKKETQAAIKGR